MKYLFSVITVLLFSIAFSFGQKVTYEGKVSDMDTKKSMSGVTIRVLENGAEVYKHVTKSNGNYRVEFSPGKAFTIEYSKPGYVTKIIKVDVVKVFEEDMPPGGNIFPPIDIDLFTERDADFSFLKTEPVVEWYFDRDRMTYDPGPTNRTKKKIIDKLEEAEQASGQNEAKYNALIQEADQLYNEKKYEQALDKYVAALQVPDKQAEKHPNNRLIEIEALLQKKAEEELAFQQDNQAYLNLIEAADNLASNKEYDKAIAKYSEASAMKSDEQYPKDKIEELKELQANAAKQEEYDKLIQQADGFFKQNSLQAARDKYQAASRVLPNEQYPQDRLKTIADQLDAQSAERERRENYNKAIEAADALFDKEDYAGAIEKYKEAITYESAATYPVERISMATTKLEEQQAANANIEAFNQLVAEGDEQVTAENYQSAVDKYNEALGLLQDNTVVVKRDNAQEAFEQQQAQMAQQNQISELLSSAATKIQNEDFTGAIADYDVVLGLDSQNAEAIAGKANAEALMAQKEAAAADQEKANQIAALLASAEEKLSSENYTEALVDFEAVLALDVQNATAIEGKGRAEALLNEKQNKAAKEAEFNQLVSEADQAFNDENWEEAKTKYIAAKGIFNDRPHVNDRIEAIRAKQEQLGNQERIAEEIQVLMDQATTLKAQNKWSEAILKYEEAIQLDGNREDIKALLTAAKTSKEEFDAQQSKEEQFAQLKQEANVLMAQKNWAGAKEKFEAALAINEDAEIRTSLELIAQKEAEEANNQEAELAYEAKMAEGESFAAAEEYEKAMTAFNEALNLKENDAVAKSRIADMLQKIDQKNQLAEKNERYNAAMVEGNKALSNKDYSAAIKFFDDALIEKPLDPEATQLKNQAKELIKGLQSEEEQYMALLNSGQTKFDEALSNNNHIPTLEEAKAIYVQAQNMRPNASLPQNKIVEIDELLRQIEEAKEQEGALAELDRQYQEQIELANVAAQDFKYQNAIDYLKAASNLKPNEQYPKTKISEYQALLDQIASQNAKDTQYTNLINKADLAFDNKNYEESIAFYNDALKVKEDEEYPKSQIQLALKNIEDIANNSVNQEYQNFIDQADAYFANKQYQEALGAYKSALSVQENDSYAKDKVDEVEQILNNLDKIEKEEAERLERFNERIAAADAMFDQENFIEAKKEYEKALQIDPNSVYANDRMQLSVVKAKEKTERGDNVRYQKILTKADEYFDDENYDKAISLYERAIKLRSYDQYPVDKIAEITAILNGNVKTESTVEYLGEEENISIIEGAALLEAGARQREQMKLESVQKELRRNEGLAEERSATDFEERVAYENEILSIKDRRDQITIDEHDKLRVFIEQVDNEEFNLEIRSNQNNLFERGAALRANQNIVYINDGMDELRQQLTHDHVETIERIKGVEEAREIQNTAEAAHHQVRVTSTEEEILKIDKQQDAFFLLSEEQRKDNEVKVDEIIKGRELRSFEERSAEYGQVVQIQDEALLAEMKVAESTEEKSAIHQQLQDDIYALDAALQRKFDQETDEAYQEQLLIDSQYTAASNQFDQSKEGKDDARQLALEVLKEMDQKEVEQMLVRSNKQYAETQNTIKEVETVQNMQDEQGQQQREDLALINEHVKDQQDAMERASELRNQDEKTQRNNTVNEIERIKKQEELANEIKAEKVKENYEDVKGLNASIDSQAQLRDEASKRDKFKTQELVNQLEENKLTFNEAIANTLGDEYPEGVSQENYIRKDKDGIPVKIVTRRFVVQNGRGDIYIRIQSRNGLTYSKNGMPVTEQSWINGTENAKLEKHY